MEPYLTIKNADKIIGQYGVYAVHNIKETKDFYRFHIGVAGGDVTVIAIGRYGALDARDGHPIFGFYNKYHMVRAVSLEWLRDMEKVLNTLVNEYNDFIKKYA